MNLQVIIDNMSPKELVVDKNNKMVLQKIEVGSTS